MRQAPRRAARGHDSEGGPVRAGRPARGTAEALVLKADGTRITETGTVRRPGKTFRNGVARSLLIGGTPWTFSDAGAHPTDASTLKGGDWLPYG